MAKIVLIQGNGFDLDLGLESSYKDFIESDEWKTRTNVINKLTDKYQSYKPYSLFLYLEKQSKESQWFDIEESIRDFVKDQYNCQRNIIPIIKIEFNGLRSDLKQYLKRISNEFFPIENRFAMKLINSLQKSNKSIYIGTFNYTDCFQLCKIQTIDSFASYTHLHNSIYDENIVLGCSYNLCNWGNKDFSFFSKANMIQNVNHLYENLSEAEEVIFFGHSLNRMDYCYFEDFFNLIASSIGVPKCLTFITKNKESEQTIRNNLGQEIVVNLFSYLKSIDFIHTDYLYSENKKDLEKWDNLIERITNIEQ